MHQQPIASFYIQTCTKQMTFLIVHPSLLKTVSYYNGLFFVMVTLPLTILPLFLYTILFIKAKKIKKEIITTVCDLMTRSEGGK